MRVSSGSEDREANESLVRHRPQHRDSSRAAEDQLVQSRTSTESPGRPTTSMDLPVNQNLRPQQKEGGFFERDDGSNEEESEMANLRSSRDQNNPKDDLRSHESRRGPPVHSEEYDNCCLPCQSAIVIRSTREDERVLTNRFYTWPRYVGSNILICGRKRSYFPFQCFIGPDWPCMLVTYCLVLAASVPFLLFVAYPIHPILGALVSCTTLSTVLFFSIAACSDPGIVYNLIEDDCKLPSDDVEVASAECGVCDMNRPVTAHHCYECHLCIDDLDHHCPWTGKCIGKRTLFYFQAFLTSLSIHGLLMIGTFLVAMMIDTAQQERM